MKYTIVLALFLGLAVDVEAVQLKQNTAIDMTDEDDSEADDDQFMQEDDEDLDDDEMLDLEGPEYEEMPAMMADSEAHGGYTRTVPERFTQERDDRLMNSIIKNYSREVKLDGKLTGHFYCNREDAMALATEVYDNHKKHDGNSFEGAKFEETWNHFDVNHDGLVEAERMPQFLRMLLGNALDIDLQ